MKIKQIIIAFAIAIPILAMTNTASSAKKVCPAAACGYESTSDPINDVRCATYSDSCYNGYRVRTCKTCQTGMSLSSATTSVVGCINTVDYNDCVFSPVEPDDCTGLCSIGTTYTTIGGTNCKTSESAACYGTQKLLSCKTCPTNYTLTTKRVITDSCGTKTFNTCVQDSSPCDGTCTNCTSDTRWSISRFDTGVESRTTKTCNTSTCKCLSSTEYRCTNGYYGTATAASNNCVECPGSGSSLAGSNDSITNCFVTSGKDGTGAYDYEPFCYYGD